MSVTTFRSHKVFIFDHLLTVLSNMDLNLVWERIRSGLGFRT